MWFEHVCKIKESKWNFDLKAIPPAIRADMGDFMIIKISDLLTILNNKTKLKQPPKIKIILRKSKHSNEDCFDTSALQFHGESKVLYQVASNFNCLELGSFKSDPFSGKYLTKLMTSKTQGPSASAGAGYGAIKRLSIHHTNEINLLSYIDGLTPRNGKILLSSVKQCPPVADICIGLHTNVKACYKRTKDEYAYNPKGVQIDQVFTSTPIVNCNDFGKCKPFLNAAYLGTYLAAINRKSPKIVLTLIGGGSFRNPMHHIVEALVKVHEEYGVYLTHGCEIELPIYEFNNDYIVNELKAHSSCFEFIYR